MLCPASMDYAGHFDTLIRPEELQDATLNAHTPVGDCFILCMDIMGRVYE